jgi:hypothetical protein
MLSITIHGNRKILKYQAKLPDNDSIILIMTPTRESGEPLGLNLLLMLSKWTCRDQKEPGAKLSSRTW